MERFFFHLTSTHDTPDLEGAELADLEAARCHAVTMIADVLCKNPRAYWEAEIYRVTVTDHNRLILFTVEMISTDAPSVAKRK